MKRQRRRQETYEAEVKGKKVRVTVPENDESGLFAAIREHVSPHAVAAIVSYLQPVSTKSGAVNKEIEWFSGQLVELLGGYEQQTRLAEELGL
jgi:hypothetical protein